METWGGVPSYGGVTFDSVLSYRKDSMVRTLVGFAGFAVVALLALKLLGWIFGVAVSLFFMLLWLAFWGFVVYLVLRIFAPGLAGKVKDTIRGNG